jgi:hypothetical protein
MNLIIRFKYLLIISLIGFIFVYPVNTNAQEEPGNFSLQVTPSPIVETLTPGSSKELDMKIRNNGNKTELLKIEMKGFVLRDGQDIELLDLPAGVSDWVQFANPTFSVKPGEIFTERVTFNAPSDSGFSYSFAFVINRAFEAEPLPGNTNLQGKVVVFSLINIDRPGAVREISVASFSASKNIYEYLPTEFTVKFKNSGNTIVQPYGNIYIQRTKDSNDPISVLPVNEPKGYILPSTERAIKSFWTDGFPVYKISTNSEGQPTSKLTWDWNNVSQFRIGKYYAKVVAVYNDGQRDIPIEGVLSFWVIPWRLLIGAAVVLGLIGVGIFTIIKKIIGLKPKKKKPIKQNTESLNEEN